MLGISRRRPSPALVIALLALVAATAGSASAVTGRTATAPRLLVGIHGVDTQVPKGGISDVQLVCPQSGQFRGSKAVSGGYTSNGADVYATETTKLDPPRQGWHIVLTYPPSLTGDRYVSAKVFVYCAVIR
jgi:hypothetical protein